MFWFDATEDMLKSFYDDYMCNCIYIVVCANSRGNWIILYWWWRFMQLQYDYVVDLWEKHDISYEWVDL